MQSEQALDHATSLWRRGLVEPPAEHRTIFAHTNLPAVLQPVFDRGEILRRCVSATGHDRQMNLWVRDRRDQFVAAVRNDVQLESALRCNGNGAGGFGVGLEA